MKIRLAIFWFFIYASIVFSQQYNEETVLASKFPGRVRISEDTLQLTFQNGDRRVFMRSQGYTLAAYIDRIGYFAIDDCDQDGACDLLILNQSGNFSTYIAGYPNFSASGQRFCCIRGTLDSPFESSTIQIWNVNSDTLNLECQLEPKNWIPSEVVWLNKHSVKIIKTTRNNENLVEKSETIHLNRQKAGWVLQ